MRVGLWNACQGRWNDRRTRHRPGVATDSGASTTSSRGSRDNLSGRGGPAKRLHSLHTRQDARPVRRWFGTGQSVPAGAAYRRHADGWRPLSASAARSSSERARGRGPEAHQGIAAHAFCGGDARVLAAPAKACAASIASPGRHLRGDALTRSSPVHRRAPPQADSLNRRLITRQQGSTRCSPVCPAHLPEPGGSRVHSRSRRRSSRLRAIYPGGAEGSAADRWVARRRNIHPKLAGRIVPLIRIRPAVHLTAPWRLGYGKGTLLTQASKKAHVPAQLLLMILPLKLSWCSHRNIELRDTTGVSRRRRRCLHCRSDR
jgi:hypothetical protein